MIKVFVECKFRISQSCRVYINPNNLLDSISRVRHMITFKDVTIALLWSISVKKDPGKNYAALKTPSTWETQWMWRKRVVILFPQHSYSIIKYELGTSKNDHVTNPNC